MTVCASAATERDRDGYGGGLIGRAGHAGGWLDPATDPIADRPKGRPIGDLQ